MVEKREEGGEGVNILLSIFILKFVFLDSRIHDGRLFLVLHKLK